jgi:hypothetical protein
MTYPERIAEINAEIKALNDKKRELIKEWVDKRHPLKVGDVVTVNGCSYEGKQMLVTECWVGRITYPDGWEWDAIGNILKKDGTPGMRSAEWSRRVTEEEM